MNRVMVIAAHPDDEVLGCGGTIVKHVKAGNEVSVLLLSLGVTSREGYSSEDLISMRHSISGAAKELGINFVETYPNLPDNRFYSYDFLDLVNIIEEHIQVIKPSIVFTHHHGDLNIDHRITNEAVVTACRPLPGKSVKELFFFEVLSSTEWGTGFNPNYFVDISGYGIRNKIKAFECYAKEIRNPPHPRSYESINNLGRLRGAFCGLGYAEAFEVGRIIDG